MEDRCMEPSVQLAEELQAQPGDKISYQTSDNDHTEHQVIYVGKGKVVHYTDEHMVVKKWLSQVTNGGKGKAVNLKGSFETFTQAEVVSRAEGKVGCSYRYDLTFSNCHNFAHWCQTGKEQLDNNQVRNCILGLGAVTVVALILHHFLKSRRWTR